MMERRAPGERKDSVHVADIRIRAANLGWMLETEHLDEADREIARIRLTLLQIKQAIRERRKLAS